MFLTSKLKKVASVFVAMALVCIYLCIPVSADTKILDTDFSDFITTDGTSAPPGMAVFNPHANDATCLPVQDSKYGTVAYMSMPKSNKNYALGFYLSATTDKAFVLETAVKRSSISGADFVIDVYANGKKMLNFGKDGNLYFGDSKIGDYDINVWYEIKIKYVYSTKTLMACINGGGYEYAQFTKEWEQFTFTECDLGFRNQTQNVASDAYLGYCRAYLSDDTNFYDNLHMSFENFGNGALSNSAHTSDDSAYYFGNGFSVSKADSESFSVEASEGYYGNSLKIAAPGGEKKFNLLLQRPYIKAFESGKYYFDVSVKVGSGMNLGMTAAGASDSFYPFYLGEDHEAVFVGSQSDEDKIAFSWEHSKWYRVSVAFDMDEKTMAFKIQDPENPSDYAEGEYSFEGFDSITELALISYSAESLSEYSYADEIRIYEAAPLQILSCFPANGAKNVSLTEKCIITFNIPVDTQSLTNEAAMLSGGGLAEDDFEVYALPGGTTIVIEPYESFEMSEEYKVTLSGVCDIFGQSLADTSIIFTTKNVSSLTTPVFKNGAGSIISSVQAGEINTSVDMVFTDNVSRPVLALFGIYNAADNSVCALTAKASNAVSSSIPLSLSAPAGKECFAQLLILDEFKTLKPYADKYQLGEIKTAVADGKEGVSLNGETLTVRISGTLEGAADKPVTIIVLKPGTTSLQNVSDVNFDTTVSYFIQTAADASGKYTHEYKMASGESGVYTVFAAAGNKNVVEVGTFLYINPDEVASALDDLNAASSANAIKTEIENNSFLLGFDLTIYNSLSEDNKNAAMQMFFDEKGKLSGGFTSSVSAAGLFDEICAFYKLNEKKTSQEAMGFIKENSDLLGFDKLNAFEAWETLSDANKLEVCKLLLDNEKITDVDKLHTFFSEKAIIFAVNNISSWSGLKHILKKNHDTLSELNLSEYLALGDTSSVDKEIITSSYKNIAELCRAVNSIVASHTAPAPSYSGGGGGGGRTPAYVPPAQENTPSEEGKTIAKLPFVDMENALWAKEAVTSLYNLGILSGKSETAFAPDDLVTREEFTKMLVTAFDKVDASAKSGFEDVDNSAWYAPYVATAVNKNIVLGQSSQKFGTGKAITRQDMCVMAYRALINSGVSLEKSGELLFADKAEISDYAYECIGAFYGNGLIKGVSADMFMPLENATRAQAAQLLYQLLEMRGGK